MLDKSRNQDGATLIEIVIVAGVLIMIMTAVVNLMVASLSRNRVAKERAVATRLSQEAAEWLKNEHARLGWLDFGNRLNNLGNDGSICLTTIPDVITDPTYSTCSCGSSGSSVVIDGSPSKFCREINLDYDDAVPNTANIDYTITTSWDDEDPVIVEGVIFRRAR